MPAPFKSHPSDTQVLNQNIRPLSECPKRLVKREHGWIEVTDVPILTGECLWHIYQKEAEEIVAPGGVLIPDPVARNRAINAAYARLWLADPRFQWAGLAAFASKQVGCGMLHATRVTQLIDEERDARQALRGFYESGMQPEKLPDTENPALKAAIERHLMAANANPVSTYDAYKRGRPLSLIQESFDFVNKMMALGNTTLFLDVYPLHAFYAKRGLEEFRKCLPMRKKIFGHSDFPVLWPVEKETLKFGMPHQEITLGFEALEEGRLAKSVEHLAVHEQKNILQPSMYSSRWLVKLLRGNHASFVTGFPAGVSQAIEVTLSSQCEPLEDGRTISFSDSIFADLSVLEERMPFVFRAAEQFHTLLNDHRRPQIEQSIREIANGAPS
jgi:hypothetical protein